ncbi:MAG: hypothetical protein FWF66_02485 [Candidatus Bathyarchaeota archaeon]|nr:hypothetical protein [Candidatus Termiticorpusculum sp.]
MQLIVNRQTGDVICTAYAEGSMHDFKLYQGSESSFVSERVLFLGDSGGYQGILKLHRNSEIPKKKPTLGHKCVILLAI